MNNKNLKYIALFLGSLLIPLSIGIILFIHNKSKNEISNESNKIEKYWEETELDIKYLTQYVNNKKCQDNSKYFLSCINSILFALEKTKFQLTINGEIKEKTVFDDLNEAQKLKEFLLLYNQGLSNNFNFDILWKQILELNESGFQKHLIASGINGFLSIDQDPHTYIGPTNYFIKVSSTNERSKYLIGVSLKKKNNKLIIDKIIKNSDADLEGLKRDDQILEINGKPTIDMTVNDTHLILKDSGQEKFKLEIIRKNETITKNIKRSYRTLSQVYGKILDTEKRVGYIQLSKFNFNVCDNVRVEIEKMNPNSLRGLIIDLRDNPGGILAEAACLAGLFIGNDKKLFSVIYKDGLLEEDSYTTSDQLYSGPMVILTNSQSASASELLAGAMKEYKRAMIIGEKTFGKGSFQEIEKWKESSKISLYKTQGFYLLPSGESTQLTGIIPDFEVNNEKEKSREINTYQFPLNYQSNNIIKTRTSNFVNSKKCLDSLGKNNLEEDIILSKAQKFLNCQIKKTEIK